MEALDDPAPRAPANADCGCYQTQFVAGDPQKGATKDEAAPVVRGGSPKRAKGFEPSTFSLEG
jgi:hypothetical protein